MATPKIGQSWKQKAVAEYTETGNLAKAAKAAGVKRRELVAAREDDREFDLEMTDALETFLDGIQDALVSIAKGQTRAHPLAGFGILKAHRPHMWHDKAQAAVQINVGTGPQITAEAVRQLFVDSLALATDESKRQLAAGVVDVTPEGA